MKNKVIAGIGSRETPSRILEQMTEIGRQCLLRGIKMRSGHAEGADWAFEQGAQQAMTVYLPWAQFNNSMKSSANFVVYKWDAKTQDLARKFHPKYDYLSFGAKKLIARDGWQILGPNLDDPVNAVVCYTNDGKDSGGTGQAIRIAQSRGIEVLNMYFQEFNTARKVMEYLFLNVFKG